MTPSLRVGIDGAQGTGKTTLLSAISKYFGRSFEYIPEASRQLADQFGIRTSADWSSLVRDPDALETFFEAEERWLLERQSASSMFIVDSSIWTIAAYRKHFNAKCDLNLARAQHYDLLLHCQPSISVEDDGFRFLDGQSAVDATYRELVEEYFDGDRCSLPFRAERGTLAIGMISDLLQKRARESSQNG